MVREFPARREVTEQGELMRGLAVRLAVQRVGDEQADCSGAVAELHLGENAKFYPSDAALAGWRAQADAGKAVIAYD
jgi:DNA polymerase-3 subunit alpha